MRTSLAALLAVLASTTPSLAEWRLDDGIAIVSPSGGNSNMELLAIGCGDPYHVEVISRGGPVLPETAEAGSVEADYFYKAGKVEARIGDQRFPLAAAGSGAAVVLYTEGSAAQDHLAPIGASFIAALKAGTTLTLAFDVTPQAGADGGGPHETFAEFPLTGSAAALDTALAPCS